MITFFSFPVLLPINKQTLPIVNGEGVSLGDIKEACNFKSTDTKVTKTSNYF